MNNPGLKLQKAETEWFPPFLLKSASAYFHRKVNARSESGTELSSYPDHRSGCASNHRLPFVLYFVADFDNPTLYGKIIQC